MDPTNRKFLLWCECNPALYTRCAIVWMGSWGPTSMAELPLLLPGVGDMLRGHFEDDDDGGGGGGMESKQESKEESKEERGGRGGGGGAGAGAELSTLALRMHESVGPSASLPPAVRGVLAVRVGAARREAGRGLPQDQEAAGRTRQAHRRRAHRRRALESTAAQQSLNLPRTSARKRKARTT